MRIKLLVWIIAIGFVAGFYRVATHALEERLEARLGILFRTNVSVRSTVYVFPAEILFFGLKAEDVDRQARLSIPQLSIQLNPFSFLTGGQGINVELNSPSFFFVRESDPKTDNAELIGRFKHVCRGVGLNRLRMRDGEIHFQDQTVVPPMEWKAQDLRLSAARNPKSPKNYLFSLLGKIQSSPTADLSLLEVRGGVAQGTVLATARISQFLLNDMAPYCASIVGAVPSAGLCTIKTNMTLESGHVLLENDLTAAHVSFSENDETIFGLTGNRLGELLQDKDGVIHLHFTVQSSVRAQADWSDVMMAAVQESIRASITDSIQSVLEGTHQKPVEELIQKGVESLGR